MKNKKTIKNGKIAELVPKQSSNGFVVQYGLPFGKRSLTSIRVYANDTLGSFTYFNNGVSSIKDTREYIGIHINNGSTRDTDVEDTLIVIIPRVGQLATASEKIYAKSHGEAVLFMHVGDTVELSQCNKGKCYSYVVRQNKNKLFLVKNNK